MGDRHEGRHDGFLDRKYIPEWSYIGEKMKFPPREKRYLEDISSESGIFKNFVVCVIGPRRAGKTYSLYDFIVNKKRLGGRDYSSTSRTIPFHPGDKGCDRQAHENMVFLELKRRRGAELFYWKDYQGRVSRFRDKGGIVHWGANPGDLRERGGDEVERRELDGLLRASEALRYRELKVIMWGYEGSVELGGRR